MALALVDIFKYVLAGTEVLLSLTAVICFIVDLIKTWDKKECKQNCRSTSRMFYVLVFTHQTIRFTLNMIPVSVYRALYKSGPAGLAVQNVWLL